MFLLIGKMTSMAESLENFPNPDNEKLEEQVLVTLEYWREYRTYFHIGTRILPQRLSKTLKSSLKQKVLKSKKSLL